MKVKKLLEKILKVIYPETYTLTTLRVFGYVTTAGKEIELYAPIGGLFTEVSLAESSVSVVLRGGSGGTLEQNINKSSFITMTISGGILIIRFPISSAFSGGNNVSLAGRITNGTFTFTV